ncbi:MAG: CYTH domain-containing protein [Minisyncoccia bacterium]
MIEIEKKFIIQQNELAHLIAGAHFLGTEKHTDIYYDTVDHVLTKRSIWLRARSGKFELKFPMGATRKKMGVTSYDEIEDDPLITQKLGFPEGRPLDRTLASLGYRPFATITTTRSKYEKEGFHIDVDDTDFGHSVVEIELMIADERGMAAATKRILDFAAAQGISIAENIRGKVIEYLRRNDIEHYHALEKTWGVEL